jgi:hypothetical protein
MTESPSREPLRPDPYQMAWAEHRHRHLVAFAVQLGCLLLALVTHRFLPLRLWLVALFTLWVGAVWVGYYRRFPCPRCGKDFYRNRTNGLWYPTWVTRCVNCGLPVGTLERDAFPEQETDTGRSMGPSH